MSENTKSDEQPPFVGASDLVDFEAAWNAQSGLLRGAFDRAAFREGWFAAMASVWDRLPMPEFSAEPMTPREVAKLISFVRRNMKPAATASPTETAQ